MMASQQRYVPNPMKHLTLNRPVQHPKTYPSKLVRGVNIKKTTHRALGVSLGFGTYLSQQLPTHLLLALYPPLVFMGSLVMWGFISSDFFSSRPMLTFSFIPRFNLQSKKRGSLSHKEEVGYKNRGKYGVPVIKVRQPADSTQRPLTNRIYTDLSVRFTKFVLRALVRFFEPRLVARFSAQQRILGSL